MRTVNFRISIAIAFVNLCMSRSTITCTNSELELLHALVVTAPMDIYQIVANAKDLAASYEDQGKEKDRLYVWYSEMIEHLRES